jgi:hypothetical protein
VTVVGIADFTRVSAGDRVAGTAAVAAAEVTVVPYPVWPATVAVLATLPLSTSAWVVV